MKKILRVIGGVVLGVLLGIAASVPVLSYADNGAILNLINGAKLIALDGYKLVLGAEDGADGGVEINIEGAVQYTFGDGSITPGVNSDVDLGTAALAYEDVFAEKLHLDNDSTSDLDADVLVATTAQPLLALSGTSATQSAAAFVQNIASAQGNVVDYLKTRAAAGSTNANTIVASGDDVYLARFWGANGATFDELAEILVESGGTPGASADMPGAITFKVSPDGSATPAAALALAADKTATAYGEVSLTTTGKTLALQEATAGSACMGTGTLNGTTAVTISTTCATTGSRIFISKTSDGSGSAANDQVGAWATNIVNATSFDIDSGDANDSATVNWIIFHEAA